MNKNRSKKECEKASMLGTSNRIRLRETITNMKDAKPHKPRRGRSMLEAPSHLGSQFFAPSLLFEK